jgi:hypothetical protein
MSNILDYPINQYVDILTKKFKIKKVPINRFLKKQNWEFINDENERFEANICVTDSGEKLIMLDNNFAIKIIK